jgi:hypothetical protein
LSRALTTGKCREPLTFVMLSHDGSLLLTLQSKIGEGFQVIDQHRRESGVPKSSERKNRRIP